MKTPSRGVLKNYDMLLKHLTSHIVDPREPIDPKDFRQSKLLINSIERVKQGRGDFVAESRVIPNSIQLGAEIFGRGLVDKEAEALRNILTMRKIVRKMPISRR